MGILFMILISLLEVILFIIFGIFEIIQIHKRNKLPHTLDIKMNNYGRVITWFAVFGVVLISKIGITDPFYLILLTVFLAFYIIGSRLWLCSYVISGDGRNRILNKCDQMIIPMYKKFFDNDVKSK